MKLKTNRRDFLKSSMMVSLASAVGLPIIYASNFPDRLTPVGLIDGSIPADIIGKSPFLTVLNDRPVNAETPAHLLNDALTPNELFFVRNNGIPPENIDIEEWTITIAGESAEASKTYTLKELQTKFEHHTYNLTLECGGNGRSEFNPPAKGNQWSTGAVGCAAWTGVRLADVLKDVGVKSNAVYIGYYGNDKHLSGDANKIPISRGVPIDKAMESESLIAWQMNGEALPLMNGFPVRLVFGGVPASCSGKWLTKIVVRDQVHDGPKMGGQSYRVPCKPVAPGAKVEDKDMCIIEKMPVKSLITYPKSGATIQLSDQLPISGKAWTSADRIQKVEYSIDFGENWQSCTLEDGSNKFAWQTFNASIKFPEKGYYEVWARAEDADGERQPIILPGWNPKGYLNNACHRIAIKVV
ncbi:sulfite oxidase [Portibacter lacus]|uniref:Molybdopterin containing oxidoreductase n=1 Tax=Portibacter lacus TaxID=1099794 RepID=A0AA37WDS4_9BACT|nr:sulfite oxidase [Portibacter lacus]GLR15899.1 molybdopterin containing oxidoreductase [Portibacter lacus]